MGLFSWLLNWRPKVREFADTYLMSRSQLNRDLVRWLPDRRRAALTLLLSHRPETFLQLQEVCNQAGVDYRIHDSRIDPAFIQETLAQYDPAPELAVTRTTTRVTKTTADTQQALSHAPVVLGLVQQLDIAERSKPIVPGNGPGPTALVSAWQYPGQRSADDSRRESRPAPPKRLAVLVSERHELRAMDNRVLQFLKSLDHPSELAFFLAFDDALLGPNIDTTLLQLLEHYGMQPNEPLQSHLLERLVRRLQRQQERRKSGQVTSGLEPSGSEGG